MIKTGGPYLAMRGAMIAKSRNIIALQVRLGANVFLERIEDMHLVLLAELRENIARKLIHIDRPGGGAGKARAGRVVRDRNQCGQRNRSRIVHLGDLRTLSGG